MSKRRLTKQRVEGIQPSDRDIVVWDEALPGFGVRVKPTGVRSYIVQYRKRKDPGSKRMTLGQHGPRLTFHQAKQQARQILADVTRGADPVGEIQEARQAPTMKKLAEDYLERHAIPKKRPNSIRNDRALQSACLMPVCRLASKHRSDFTSRRTLMALHH